MKLHALLQQTKAGLYCEQGDFYIDPQRTVSKAVITHGHSDHARRGARFYLTSVQNEHILRARLGQNIRLQTVPYGEPVFMNGVRVSCHPAGHILGSSQIRLEYHGAVCVISGDYAMMPDTTCAPFESVRCETFVTEVTFGLPIYTWPSPATVFQQINRWWSQNAEAGITSILYAYSLGKAQRLIAGVDASIGPIVTHETVEGMNAAYRQTGIALPTTIPVQTVTDAALFERALLITPSSTNLSEWLPNCQQISTAFASGWMQKRNNRKRSSIDRGFVLSDHVDWEGLLTAIKCSAAHTVWMTHGDGKLLSRYLQEKGLKAEMIG